MHQLLLLQVGLGSWVGLGPRQHAAPLAAMLPLRGGAMPCLMQHAPTP